MTEKESSKKKIYTINITEGNIMEKKILQKGVDDGKMGLAGLTGAILVEGSKGMVK